MSTNMATFIEGAIILSVCFAMFWLIGKVLKWLFVMAYTGPLWLRIILWPYKMIALGVLIWCVADQARATYQWLNKPRR